MALINCSECGKQMSDKAEACPFCGNPGEKTEKVPQKEIVYIQPKQKSGGGVWVFVGVLIAIVLIIIIVGSL